MTRGRITVDEWVRALWPNRGPVIPASLEKIFDAFLHRTSRHRLARHRPPRDRSHAEAFH